MKAAGARKGEVDKLQRMRMEHSVCVVEDVMLHVVRSSLVAIVKSWAWNLKKERARCDGVERGG